MVRRLRKLVSGKTRLSVKLITIFSVLLFGLSIVAIAGCSSSNKTSKDAGKTNTSDNKKQELTVAIGGEPDNGFDPTTGWGRYGSPLFQSTLLARDNDLKIINDLAIDHTVSSDGLTWTVTLRTDAKFSDGKPVTADDVVYTFETAAKSGSVVDLNVMKSVKAEGADKVVFTLNKPQSTFVSLLVSLGIVPKHAHDKNYADKPLGSGPYKFIQYDKGQQLIVEANPHYYGEKPYFKKITFLFVTEDAAFAAAKAGKVDLASVPPSLAKQEIDGMKLKAVDSVDNRGILFPMVPEGQKTKDGYPIGNNVTSDVAIRKAINTVIDRESLVEGVLEGYGSPAYSVCDNLAWWNPDTVIADNDLGAAKKILADAGWKDADNDGILEKGTLKAQFTLVYPADDQTRQSLALAAVDMIKPLGIDIELVGKSWDDIKTLMYSNAVLFGWGSHDPLEMYNLYSSTTRGYDWYNTGYYSNSAVDNYMSQALAAISEEKALEFWKKAQWDGKTGFSAKGDAPWAWLVNLDHCYFIREGINTGKQRIEPHGHGWPITANITEWTRDE